MDYTNISLNQVKDIYNKTKITQIFLNNFLQTMKSALTSGENSCSSYEDKYWGIPTYLELDTIYELNNDTNFSEKSEEFTTEFMDGLQQSGIKVEEYANAKFLIDYDDIVNLVSNEYRRLTEGKVTYLITKINEMVIKNANDKNNTTSPHFNGNNEFLPKITNAELEQLVTYYEDKGFTVISNFEKDDSYLVIKFQ